MTKPIKSCTKTPARQVVRGVEREGEGGKGGRVKGEMERGRREGRTGVGGGKIRQSV